jgi:predicted nucleotidyltransferase
VAELKQLQPVFDLGHQGDVDYTQISKYLAMTPTQRLRHHEGWRPVLLKATPVANFLEDMVTRLAQAQVEFVIVGGVSAVLQGAPITTRDLDVCYRRTPANISRLVSALAPLHPRPRGFPPELPFFFDERAIQLGSNFTLEIGDESLDLLGLMSAIGGYEEIINQAEEKTVAGHKVKVLPLALLIATKQAAGRPKDLAVIPELKATLEMQRKNSGQDQ